MTTSTKTRITRRLPRLVGAVVHPALLAYVRWAIRDEPFERKDLLGSRLVSVLQAELDQRAPEVVAARVKLEAAEREAAERERRAAAFESFKSLESNESVPLQ